MTARTTTAVCLLLTALPLFAASPLDYDSPKINIKNTYETLSIQILSFQNDLNIR